MESFVRFRQHPEERCWLSQDVGFGGFASTLPAGSLQLPFGMLGRYNQVMAVTTLGEKFKALYR